MSQLQPSFSLLGLVGSQQRCATIEREVGNGFGAIQLPSGGNLLTTETREDARSTGHAGELVGRQLFSEDTEIV